MYPSNLAVSKMWLNLSYGTQVKLANHISNIICDCTAAISSFFFFFLFKALLQIWFSFLTPVHWRDTWDYKSVVKIHISWNLEIKKFDFLMKNFDSALTFGLWLMAKLSWGQMCSDFPRVLVSQAFGIYRICPPYKPHAWKADLKIWPPLNLYVIQGKVFQNHVRQEGLSSLFFLFSGNEVLTSVYCQISQKNPSPVWDQNVLSNI